MEQKKRMPAEYETHAGTLMSWPVMENMSYPENYSEFTSELVRAAILISRFEPVTVLVNSVNRHEAESMLEGYAEIIEIEHDDCWIRDNGPTIVMDEDKKRKGINWNFNAWGNKYPCYRLDNTVAPLVLRSMGIPEIPLPIVMEGGAFHTDGEGTLLTTEECLLNKNRNPDMSRKDIEKVLMETIGVEKIIWLPHGLFGDETDGHIDNLACFASPGTVLLQVCNNPADPDYCRSREHIRILQNETDAKGRKLKLIPIPQPPVRMYRNKRMTLSYINFYFVNKGIILPLFCKSTDREVIETLKAVFPERKIVTIDGHKLAKEGGNIHCLTQQVPQQVGVLKF